MPISLQSALAQISDEFAHKVFELIRTAFVAELSNVTLSPGASAALGTGVTQPTQTIAKAAKGGSKTTAKRGRLERRSSESIAKTLDGIVALLRKKPGLGSEAIQKALGIARNEIARPIALGITTGVLRKTGTKRATKYSAGTTSRAAKPADATSKKPGRKNASATKTTKTKKATGRKKAASAKKITPTTKVEGEATAAAT